MKLILYFLAVAGLVLSAAPRAFAHKLAIDGTIGVTIHVDPDDEPAQGKESKIFVDITDTSGRFNATNPAGCMCVLSVIRNTKTIATLPVVSGNTYAQIRYTFPESGTYTLAVSGKPTRDGVIFQAFSTEFEYYVKGSEQTSEDNPLEYTIPFVVAFAGVVIILLVSPWLAKSSRKKS